MDTKISEIQNNRKTDPTKTTNAKDGWFINKSSFTFLVRTVLAAECAPITLKA